MSLHMAGICLVPLLKRLNVYFLFICFNSMILFIILSLRKLHNYRTRNWERKGEGLTPSP